MQAVDHINVDVEDLGTCFEFYRDTLDLELVREPSDFQGDHAMFRAGETIVTLVENGNADQWHERGIDQPLDKAHIAFETDREPYEAFVERLGDQFPKQGPYDWGEFEGFYFLDPSGNLLEVITRDEPTRDRTLLTHDDVEA